MTSQERLSHYYSDKHGENGGSSDTMSASNQQGGCHVSAITGFILLLLALVIAVGVGVVVFFATSNANSSKDVVCKCEYPADGGTTGALGWNEVCINITNAGKPQECLVGLPCTAPPPGVSTVAPDRTTTTTTITTTTDPPAEVNVRLPGSLLPLHYTVELFPDMYKDNMEEFTITGSVEITMECKTATKEVVLHINEMTIDDSSIEFAAADGASGAPSKMGEYEEDKEKQFFIQKLDRDTTPGNTYKIKMSFTAALKKGLAGLYLSEYQEANQTKYMATTQFQATDARKAFPCFDEPGIKSTFDITLVRMEPMISLSNMPIKETVDRPGGLKADIYNTTVKMPTYLLAFVVCDFEYKEGVTTRGTKFRVWSRREAIEQTAYALDVGIKILTYFEDYFNVPFPLPKQDMIAAPDFAAGAMENWGLIIYRETALLYDPAGSSASNKQRVAVVVSHELAHQWYGNLVTPSWWDDLWLNEGFASYVEYLGVNHVEPTWQMNDQFVVEDLQNVFLADGLASSHPIYVPVYHPDEISEIFDVISYAKGASIIRMMNNFLSEETFKNGLTRYLNKFQYGNAHHTDLWASLKEQADVDNKNIDVGTVMNTWVRQMGYPVITISRSGSYAIAKQTHFLIDPSQEPDPKYPTQYNYRWEVPLTYRTKSDSTVHIQWMHQVESLEVEGLPADTSDWMLANVEQMGYYRVDYDLATWDILIAQLRNDHTVIDVKNRAQLIDDAFNLARAGVHNVNQVKALETTGYLSKEQEFVPWRAAMTNLNYMNTMLATTDAYGEFTKYMLSNLEPIYNTIGWNDSLSGPHLGQYLRALVLAQACGYGHRPCLDEASRLFKEWMDNPSQNNISPNLKYIVYCNAIKNGGVEEWDFAYTKFSNENLAAEKDRLRAALACASEPWILGRYLTWTMDGTKIRSQDALSTVVYVSRNVIGSPLAWNFMRANWDYLYATYGQGFFSFSSMVGYVATPFNTEYELQQLREFRDQQKALNKLGSAERAFEQAIETVSGNIQWLQKNKAPLYNWLVEFNLNKK